MIIVRLTSGLGNQMFQYAFYKALENKTHYSVKLDTKWFEKANRFFNREYGLNVFKVNYDIANDQEIKKIKGNEIITRIQEKYNFNIPFRKYIIDDKPGNYKSEVFKCSDGTYFSGYWQTEKYFDFISDDIKKDFTFKRKLKDKNLKLKEEIKNTKSVSLHIRRGDYLNKKHIKDKFGDICTKNYYYKAIKYIKKKLGKFNLYIFSNDIEWAKKNMNFDLQTKFIDWNKGTDSYIDLQLMSVCQHNIIANSTFSWWGAWLNSNDNKIVISPSKWVNNNYNSRNDVIPDRWIKI